MIEIERAESVTAVDASEWDRLAGDEAFTSHGWLRTLEETYTEAAGYRYLMARRAGELVGAVACQLHLPGRSASPIDQFLFGPATSVARRLRLAGVPVLVGGTRFGMAEPVLLRPNAAPATRKLILRHLVRAMQEEARRLDAMLLVRHVARSSAPGDALGQAGFLRTREMPTACLELGWKSFADFRRHLSEIHPSTEKGMRWEINRGRRAGVVVERMDEPGPVGAELHRLLDAHYRRLNYTAFPFGPAFVERLSHHLGPRAVVTVARRAGEILGVTVGLRGSHSLALAMIGVDAERGRPAALYFNLAFNWPIQHAIAAGDRRLYLGKMLYDVKIRRGCRLLPLDLYLRGRNPVHQVMLSPLVALRSARLDRRAAAIVQRARPRQTQAGGARGRSRLRVLVTNATSDAGLAAIRALARRGFDVYGVDVRRLPLGARSRFSRAQFVLPDGSQAEFETALLDLVHRLRPDAFLPLGNRAVMAAARLTAPLRAVTALNVPDAEAFMAAYDKATCLESCRSLGIAAPESYSMEQALAVLGHGEGREVVVKPGLDQGAARGVRYVRDSQALAREWAECQRRFGSALVQEYIPGGPEAMKTLVVLFSRDSSLVAAFTAQKFRQWPPRGGLTVVSRSTDEQALLKEVLPFFERWRWKGPAEVELKFDHRDGRHKVIEINPRFPAYLRFPVRAGLDLPSMAVDLALGDPVEPSPGASGYAVGATYVNPGALLRSVTSDLRRAAPGFGALVPEVWRGLPSVFDVLTDPVPLIGRALAQARRAVRDLRAGA